MFFKENRNGFLEKIESIDDLEKGMKREKVSSFSFYKEKTINKITAIFEEKQGENLDKINSIDELENDIRIRKEPQLTFWEILKIEASNQNKNTSKLELKQKDNSHETKNNSLTCCTIL